MIETILVILGLVLMLYAMISFGYDGNTFKEKLFDFYGDLKSVFIF